MRPTLILPLILIPAAACGSAVRTAEPDPWKQLSEQYARIESTRGTFSAETGSRRDRIAAAMNVQQQIEPVWLPFMSALEDYHRRTGDARAAAILTREKILLGDHYADLLARYDRAIEIYLDALSYDPDNEAVRERIRRAREKVFVAPSAFNSVTTGMREPEVVNRLGYPRIDWIKQVVRSGKVYQAWIYPRSDGGAAAVYFEDGRVYHKNWQAAPARGGGR